MGNLINLAWSLDYLNWLNCFSCVRFTWIDSPVCRLKLSQKWRKDLEDPGVLNLMKLAWSLDYMNRNRIYSFVYLFCPMQCIITSCGWLSPIVVVLVMARYNLWPETPLQLMLMRCQIQRCLIKGTTVDYFSIYYIFILFYSIIHLSEFTASLITYSSVRLV